jgi:MFS family permease
VSRAPAFQHAGFRVYWAGLLVSQIGTWMQTVSLGWLVFRLTGSALALGVVTVITALPAGLLVLVGGVLADRFSRRSIILAAQTLAMTQALILTVLTWLGVVQLWHVIGLAIAYSLASVLDEGARHAILADLVPAADVANASDGIMSARVIARVAGSASAGIVLAQFGEAACFGLNSLSYGVMIAAVALLRLSGQSPASRPDKRKGDGMIAQVAEAARFAVGPAGVAIVVALVALNNFFLMALVPMLPAFVGQVLGKGGPEVGWLNAAFGVGALAGAGLVAASNVRGSRAPAFGLVTLVAPLLGVLFSALRWLPASAAVLAALGACVVGQTTLGNGLLQAHSPPEMRGRLMSLNALFIYGATRVGAVVLGAGVEWLGFSRALLAGALVCLVASAPGVYRLQLRR